MMRVLGIAYRLPFVPAACQDMHSNISCPTILFIAEAMLDTTTRKNTSQEHNNLATRHGTLDCKHAVGYQAINGLMKQVVSALPAAVWLCWRTFRMLLC